MKRPSIVKLIAFKAAKIMFDGGGAVVGGKHRHIAKFDETQK